MQPGFYENNRAIGRQIYIMKIMDAFIFSYKSKILVIENHLLEYIDANI